MTKRRIITLVALAIFIGLVLLASTVKGQGCPNDYACAKFYINSAWPRDGLVEHWTLDPGVRGSVWQNSSFEQWDGSHATCTDCPTDSIICLCTPPGDIQPSTSTYFDFNTSMRMTTGGFLSAAFYLLNTWDVGTCYQISFWYRGETGNEDFNIVVGNTTLTDSYDFTTDTFTVPLTTSIYTSIPTTWTRASLYIVGAAGKTAPTYGVAFFTANTNGDYTYIDNVRMQELNSCTVTGSRENVLSVPVTSDPLWGYSEAMLPRTGTGPAYKTGMRLDGVNDYLSCADEDCEMDPVNWASGGSFSAACRVMPHLIAGADGYLLNKYVAAAGQRSWTIRAVGVELVFYVSDDGTNIDSNTVNVFTLDALHSFVSTFDSSGGSGACENNLYYDAYQVDTDATMTECVPFDTPVDFTVGAQSAFYWPGSILECSMWDRELSAIEANKYISPYFPATNYGPGFYVDTCSQAASHATCSTQVCRDGTPNACQAEGTGVAACFGEYDVLPENNSWESNNGTDDSPDWPDWQELSTSELYAYHDGCFHGDSCMRMRASSSATTNWVATECLSTSKNDTTFSMKIKALKDTVPVSDGNLSGFYVYVSQYTAGCASKLGDFFYEYDPQKGGWEDFVFTITSAMWHTNAGGYYVSIVVNNATQADILVDAIHITESSYRVPFVRVPAGGGVVTYNSRQYELHNPLSDYCESEDADCYLSGFCASAWVYTDWVANDGIVHYFMGVPGTAGNNNRWHINKSGDNNLVFQLYDNVGASRYYFYGGVTPTEWSVGWHYVEVCSNNSDNVLWAHHYNVNNSTWYDWDTAADGGTGIQSGQTSNLYVGHFNNTEYLDGYVPVISISPYSDIFPLWNFNNGNPPVNHHPYAGEFCAYDYYEIPVP